MMVTKLSYDLFLGHLRYATGAAQVRLVRVVSRCHSQ